MRSGRPLFAVTHCHSLQSSNRSSPMDALIRSAVERVTGEPADDFDWAESLTTAEELAGLLHARDEGRRIDLLFLTDHVNETTGGFHPDLVDLAIEEPRVALGAEIQTVTESPLGSGRMVEAPEVLVYGGVDRVPARGGWHHGLNDALLREIQAASRPPGGGERAELHRLLAACRERGLAHALAHPLDGHRCDLPATLAAITACRFVEVVNGGFSGDSTRRLLGVLALHERLAGGDRLGEVRVGGPSGPGSGPDGEDPETVARWLVERLGTAADGTATGAAYVTPGIVPWGGSDAHLGDYARVRMVWDPPAGAGRPGIPELLRDMVERSAAELKRDRVFRIDGRASRLGSCLSEVLRLVARNARRNRETFRGIRRQARLAAIGTSLAISQVLHHRRVKERRGRALDRVLAEAEGIVAPDGGPPAAEEHPVARSSEERQKAVIPTTGRIRPPSSRRSCTTGSDPRGFPARAPGRPLP